MRVVTIVDGDGAIKGLMTVPEDGLRPSIPGLPPDHQEVEIEVPDISAESDETEVSKKLSDLVRSYRVDVTRKAFVAR